MGAVQKFEIIIEYDKNLEKAKGIISKSELIGDLLKSKKNCSIYENYKELHVFDEAHYPLSLYRELSEIKKKLKEAGYEARVFYLNVEDMDEIED